MSKYFDGFDVDRPPSKNGWFANFLAWVLIAGAGLLAAVLACVAVVVAIAVPIVLLWLGILLAFHIMDWIAG